MSERVGPLDVPEWRRRLSAVMSADVEGYSRLIALDDEATVAALDAARQVFRRHVAVVQGRVIDEAGDSVLAVFDTAAGAMAAALKIQQEIDPATAPSLAGGLMRFRIGLHLGDIIQKADGTVYGDGVNIAARLQALAVPGGIVVSELVRAAVAGRTAVQFVDLGEQHLKNIATPVRAHRVVLTGLVGGPRRRVGPSLGRRGAAVLATVVASILVLWWAWSQRQTGTAASRLSLAVLPFTSTGNDQAEKALAEGLTRGVTLGLVGAYRGLRLGSADRAAQLGGRDLDTRRVGQELGVRYLLRADVAHVAERIEVDARLLDAEADAQVAARRFRLDSGPTDRSRDLLVARITEWSHGAVRIAEIERAKSVPGGNAHYLVAQADALLSKVGPSLQEQAQARRLYEQAAHLDPRLVDAWVGIFWTLNLEFEDNLAADRDTLVARMASVATAAVDADPADAAAWGARATVLAWQGRFAEAQASIAEAQRLDPSSTASLSLEAFVAIVAGRPEDSLAAAQRAIAQHGTYRDWTVRFVCWSTFALGRPIEAVPDCERASALSNGWWRDQEVLLAAYAQSGQLDKAAPVKAELLRRQPTLTIERLSAQRYSDHPRFLRWQEQVFAGLRAAGVPER